MSYLDAALDSSFIIDALRGRPAARTLAKELADQSFAIGIPAPVLHEVRTGLLHTGGRAQAERFGSLFARFPILPFDENAARRSSEIQAEALVEGRAHGEMDAMIAGIALEVGAELVTRDDAFGSIAQAFGLRLRRY